MEYSQNPLGADNQQERLIDIGWITGFIDGEGCFSCGIVRQQNRAGRKGYKTGYQVFHEFAVTQGEKSLECLLSLKDFFGVGKVYVNRRYDNHKENLYRLVVRNRQDLSEVIVPFFKRYRLRTAKKDDFEKFAKCLMLVNSERHITHAGLIEILEIVETMNRKKSRQDLIRILRDYTPDTQDIE